VTLTIWSGVIVIVALVIAVVMAGYLWRAGQHRLSLLSYANDLIHMMSKGENAHENWCD